MPLANPDVPVAQAFPGHLASPDAHRQSARNRPSHLAVPVPQDHQATLVRPDHPATLDPPVSPVDPATMDLPDHQDPRDHPDLPESRDATALVASPDDLPSRRQLCPVTPALPEIRDRPVCPERLVDPVRTVNQDRPDPEARPDLPDRLDSLAIPAVPDRKARLVSRANVVSARNTVRLMVVSSSRTAPAASSR